MGLLDLLGSINGLTFLMLAALVLVTVILAAGPLPTEDGDQ